MVRQGDSWCIGECFKVDRPTDKRPADSGVCKLAKKIGEECDPGVPEYPDVKECARGLYCRGETRKCEQRKTDFSHSSWQHLKI